MQTRSVTLLIAIIAVVLAACGTTATSQDPSPEASASAPPSTPPSAASSDEPAPSPSEWFEAGTLTMVDGVSAGGPGIALSEAIAADTGEPMIVNGILLMDQQGTIWLCEAFAGGGIPSCGDPSLRVLGYPEATSDWDMAHAAMTGLQEAEGIRWFDEAKIFGVVEP